MPAKNFKLINPRHLQSEHTTKKNDFFYRAYVNALQYYMDDPTCDADNISFPSMFLYSMGDKNILHSPELKRDEYGDRKLELPSNEVKKDLSFYSDNLIVGLQFRLQDRKYVLDINTYKSSLLKDFLDIDVDIEHNEQNPLFKLMMRNFKLNYFKLPEEKKYSTLFTKLNDSKESSFDGIFDEKDFQERYAKDNDNRQVLDLDGYFKTELKEWQVKYERTSLVDSKAIDLYPYVNSILYDNNKYLVVIVVTERDENYIDDKTAEINKVFECSMFIYKNESERIKQEDLRQFNENLRFYIGRFINNCSLYKLQEAMNGAIGEASDISRHWYSKGLDDIFNKETAEENENTENSIEFYTKFIKELLCKIEGVENTEIYPFDRVFIFPETGLENDFTGLEKVRVLEAKIKSREPSDRGAYLMGWEQDAQDSEDNTILDEKNDLIFSDKKVNYMDWDVRDSFIFEKEIATVNRKHIQGNLLLSNLLLEKEFLEKTIKDKTGAENKKLVNMKRKIRDNFNEYGLFYEYEFGLDLFEQYPVLMGLQEKYFDIMAEDKIDSHVTYDDTTYNYNFKTYDSLSKEEKEAVLSLEEESPKNALYYRGNTKKRLIQKMKENIRNEYKAKTITVCFDPERITKPELASTVQYLKRKDAITMVFVADKDIVKTTSELQAEIEDFKVLIQMVIRQVIYNTESAAKQAEIKKQLQGMIPHTIHEIKSLVKDGEIQEKIDALFIQLNEKLYTDENASATRAYSFNSANIFNELMHKFFEEQNNFQESINFQEKIEEWLPQKHTVKIVVNEIFLPHMQMLWDDLSIPKAFKVLLKNATEYTHIYSQNKQEGEIILSVNIEHIKDNDFLVLNIVNHTPAITKSRFEKLNDTHLDELGKDTSKKGSTGIGVVQARRQIKALSSLNNIAYTMIAPNIISAKMYLKVDLQSNLSLFCEESTTTVENTTPIVSKSTETCDILYFEDSQEYYEENLKFLSKYNLSTFHDVRKNELYMKDAKILLTDMSILNESGDADEEEGLEGIYLFKEKNQNNAPVCILSNGEAGAIKTKVYEHLDDLIDSNDIIIFKEFNANIEAGKIYIFNNIKLLNDSLQALDDYLSAIQSKDQEEKTTQEEGPAHNIVPFLKDEEYNTSFLNSFSKLEHSIAENFFYIASISEKEASRATIVSKWFEFKTARSGKGTREFMISNVTYHKNTLLIVNNVTLKDPREKWWLFYLGITHNIIFNFLEYRTPQLLSIWSEFAIKRESSGYLGKLRHDIKNYEKIYENAFKETTLLKEFEKIVTSTLELQKLLQLDKYQNIKQYTQVSSHGKQKATEQLSHLHTLKYSTDVESLTQEIYKALSDSIEILEVSHHDNVNVNNLILFKKLVRFNLDFCQSKV